MLSEKVDKLLNMGRFCDIALERYTLPFRMRSVDLLRGHMTLIKISRCNHDICTIRAKTLGHHPADTRGAARDDNILAADREKILDLHGLDFRKYGILALPPNLNADRTGPLQRKGTISE